MRESLRRLAFTSDAEMDVGIRRSAIRRVRVELLNGEFITLEVDRKCRGSALLDKVCENLDVLEKDYFGLLYEQRGDNRMWVDLGRRLSKTFRNEPWDVRFAVKFYPPEPSELQDDATRYQLVLAVRRDLCEGRLSCSSITYALLASYILQAEFGDYAPGNISEPIIAEQRLVPTNVMCDDVLIKIEELYKKHKGQSPAEAELSYLENAKKLSLYGAEVHTARDILDVEIALAISSRGLAVYRDTILINRIPWTMIRKLSYKKRVYTLCLRAGECEDWEPQVSFKTSSSRAAKKLWRCSVEHHMFFRRASPVTVDRIAGFPRFGSRRVSCRSTLQQMREKNCTMGLLITS